MPTIFHAFPILGWRAVASAQRKAPCSGKRGFCCMQRKTIGLFKGVGHCIHYARRDWKRSIGTTYANQHWDSEGSFGHTPDGAGVPASDISLDCRKIYTFLFREMDAGI